MSHATRSLLARRRVSPDGIPGEKKEKKKDGPVCLVQGAVSCTAKLEPVTPSEFEVMILPASLFVPGVPPSGRSHRCGCRRHPLDPHPRRSPCCRLPVVAALLPANLQGCQAAGVHQ